MAGYRADYMNGASGDLVEIDLLRFSDRGDAKTFFTEYTRAGTDPTHPWPDVPGAQIWGDTSASSAGYDHGIIASREGNVMLLDDFTDTFAPPRNCSAWPASSTHGCRNQCASVLHDLHQ